MINEKESELLRKWLPKGTYMNVAAELGYSHAFIVKVAKGDRNNEIILSHLVELAAKNKIESDRIKAEIQKLEA